MKKAQLKIQEMAFVLLAIVLLFSLVLLFFVAFQSREINKLAQESREERAITMLEVISALPELRCSSSFSSTSEAVCLDYDKVLAFSNDSVLQNRYSIFWDNSYLSKVEIQEVYPTNKNYVIYSKTTNENTKTYATYAALCLEEESMSCKIAKIRATLIVPKNT